MAKFHIAALLALFAVTAVSAADSIFNEAEATVVPHAQYNEKLQKFEFWNETVVPMSRRKSLGIGSSSPVTVTFYNSPGMDCTTGQGQCGYGDDVNGPAYGRGGPFVETSLYPYHAASGNMEWLGGCGSCGVLSYKGNSRGFVITDVTDHLDELDHSSGLPGGSHIDLCLPSFQYFEPGTTGNSGGIFTATWTRVDCSCMGAPNYPDNAITVRTQAYNPYAKAVVISRVGGVGEIASVNFKTRNGGFTSGARVTGWGAWWMPTSSIAGQGGVELLVTLVDGTSINTQKYPLPDYNLWDTGNLYNYFDNVGSC